MTTQKMPSLSEFVSGPLETVQDMAPATMIYAPGGTRRSAAFSGIDPWSRPYIEWARHSSIDAFDLIFRHGVSHLISPAITPGNIQESNQYSEQLYAMTDWVLAGQESLEDYAQRGWKVRLLGGANIPELRPTIERLQQETDPHATKTVWWTFAVDYDTFWQELLKVAQKKELSTREDLICAFFGESIPLATLYLAFGKPTASTAILLPLLFDNLQCYWSQQVGYSLTEEQLRTILYDYAYLRNTWRADKLDRAYEASAHQAAWEQGPTIGLGMRLGPFWYPAPMNSPAWTE